jgi:hypothetical protein
MMLKIIMYAYESCGLVMKETVAAANGGGGFGLVWCCGMVVSAAV